MKDSERLMKKMNSEIEAWPKRISDLYNQCPTAALCVPIGILAIFLRLHTLGGADLNEPEAKEAMTALRLAQGTDTASASLPTSPLLHTLQAMTFWMTGTSNEYLARFWPAMAGSAVVFTPFLFRGQMDRSAMLLASFLLTLSPAMLAASRVGDATTLTLLCIMGIVLGLQLFWSGDHVEGLYLCGAALGAGFASGSRFVSGLLVAAACMMMQPPQRRRLFLLRLRLASKGLAVPAIVSFLVWATAGLHYKLGLSAVGGEYATWFGRWVPEVSNSTALMPMVLAILYDPLAVIFGLPGIYLALIRYRPAATLPGIVAAGLVFAIMYPGRQSADVLWFSVPLTMLGAVVLVKIFGGDWNAGEAVIVALQCLVSLVLVAFAYVTVAGYAYEGNVAWYGMKWGALALGLTLIAVSGLIFLLFAAGGAWRTARRGAIAALLITMLAYAFATGWRMTQVRAGNPRELWNTHGISDSLELLVETISDISLRTVGESHDLEMTVLGEGDGLLGWTLREFRQVDWIDHIGAVTASTVVITPSDLTSPMLNENYLGQEFGFLEHRKESLWAPVEWLNYSLFRQVAVARTHLVLWVQEDAQLE